MTENVPPTSSAAAANTAADQPGRPYYESLRSTLRGTLEKKRKLDEQLAALEEQIFKTEGTYLEETAASGNIVRGFDGWVKGVVVGGRGGADDRRRGRVRDEDRIFSRSSVSWMKVISRFRSLRISDAVLTRGIGAGRTRIEYHITRGYAHGIGRWAALDARPESSHVRRRQCEDYKQEEAAQ